MKSGCCNINGAMLIAERLQLKYSMLLLLAVVCIAEIFCRCGNNWKIAGIPAAGKHCVFCKGTAVYQWILESVAKQYHLAVINYRWQYDHAVVYFNNPAEMIKAVDLNQHRICDVNTNTYATHEYILQDFH